MYDTIKADLKCPYCGTRAEVEMQTRAFAYPSFRQFVVGGEVTLASDLGAAGYLRIGKSDTGTVVLESWSCPRCGAWRWSRIEVIDDRLASVTAVSLTESVAASTDYIADDFWPFLSDVERQQVAVSPNSESLRKALIRIQNDIEAHRDDPPTGFESGA